MPIRVSLRTKNYNKIYQGKSRFIAIQRMSFFICYGSTVYTFSTLGNDFFFNFKEHILDENMSKNIYIMKFWKYGFKNHYVELLNEFIKEKLRTKVYTIILNTNLYYFAFNPEKDTVPLVVEAYTRVRREKLKRR